MPTKAKLSRSCRGVLIILTLNVLLLPVSSCRYDRETDQILKRIGTKRGICVILNDVNCQLALKLARKTELLIYVQLPQARDVEVACRIADTAGFYGTRIYIEKGRLDKIHLANNLADVVIAPEDTNKLSEQEILRVLRPQGKALLGQREIVKPFPEGIDDWSHPYHGPDNNPQSKDRIAIAPYLTQFLANPRYAPFPQATVASTGRVFKAFGHVAFHKREEPFLNKLVAFNGYNGTILWTRDLPEGIMVHRNTMIATPATLYLGDDKSCKLIDAATGRIKDEIVPPAGIAGGTFWKWMGMEDGVLYALLGQDEPKDSTQKWLRKAHGWRWAKISKGYNQPQNPWGYGSNVLAIDPKTKKVLWSHRESEPIDSRAMCMKNGRIYIFRFDAFLACLNAKTGDVIWRKTLENAPELFKAIGPDQNQQGAWSNWRTAAYVKCSDDALYFAGPQLDKLIALSTKDGSILWADPYDNYQLVLHDDSLYSVSGPMTAEERKTKKPEKTKKLDPLTGEVLNEISIARVTCTRPTGAMDAVFFRAWGGTIRLDTAADQPQWISPMRPSCHDGVTIANGLLYWWPMVCDCQFQLYGVTCLGPAGDFNFTKPAHDNERLEKACDDSAKVASLSVSPADWPTFRANNRAGASTQTTIPEKTKLLWKYKPKGKVIPTAPTTVGGIVFVSSSDGIVRAFEASTGKILWQTYTAGAVRFSPTIWNGRAFVGSGDGWVYSYEAKTGRLLWRFRAAPAERKIPVYDTLLSTWPAAGGVLVEDGTAYVAAGIVNYDGTYVYALDAETGKIKWHNNTSGHLDPQARTGVSVQGHMVLYDGRLCLAGGTSVSPAIYDAANGKCLNDAGQLRQRVARSPRGWDLYLFDNIITAGDQPFYSLENYPIFGAGKLNKVFLSSDADRENILIKNTNKIITKMFLTSNGSRDIVWLNDSRLRCYNHVNQNRARTFIEGFGKFDIPEIKPLWGYDSSQSALAVAVCENAVVIAERSQIVAVDMQDGGILWSHPLPAAPVRWGLALDRDGRVIVTLEDGQILCFG